MNILSRKEAKRIGSQYYFTGKPCKHNHINRRYVRDYTCISCKQERTRAATEKGYFKDNYKENKDQRKRTMKVWAQNNSDKVLAASKAWNERNKDRMSEYTQEFYADPVNKQQFLNTCKEYRNNNKEKYAHYMNMRRAKKLNATPSWLTEKDEERIQALYTEAHTLTEQTGVLHEVDHYYPLQGKTVCGLHIPSNLQILTKTENTKKSNKHPDLVDIHHTIREYAACLLDY